MTIKNKLVLVALTTFVATTVVFAEEGSVNEGAPGMNPPPMGRPEGGPGGDGRPGGFLKQMFGERREEVKEFREDRREAVKDLREGIKDKREYLKGNASGTMATPTPWKNFKEDVKDLRKELREDLRPRMASLTESQITNISTRLGITIDALKAQLASGTPLKEIVKDKIPKDEMEKIIPKMASGTFASTTRRIMRREEGGFFNSFRERFFGAAPKMEYEGGEMQGEVVSGEGSFAPQEKVRNFFKRFFNF